MCSIPSDVIWVEAVGDNAGCCGSYLNGRIELTDLAAGERLNVAEVSANVTVTNYVQTIGVEPYSATDDVDVRSASKGVPGYRYFATNRVVSVVGPMTISVPLGARVAGIAKVASTVVHELCHDKIAKDRGVNRVMARLFQPPSLELAQKYGFDSMEYAQAMVLYKDCQYRYGDSDGFWGDGVRDEDERTNYLGVYSDVMKRDTFNLQSVFPESGYAECGDEEVRCRLKELEDLTDMFHVELDWCNPGCQHAEPHGPQPRGNDE